ncbi:MAG: hypothetical protein OEY28_02490 [Nitrospira sp.]|nr:hypothetical protein [Nitrospira sp.]
MKPLIITAAVMCAASPAYAGTSGVVMAFGYTPPHRPSSKGSENP